MIIDVAIPSEYNTQKKATEKMSKYVDLQTECQRMWTKRVQVIPVIIGATGVHQEVSRKNTRLPQHLQPTETSIPRNSRYPEKGTINKARVSNRT